MKLLTWMHRKFKQGGNETLKDFSLGQAFLDDHQVYHKQNHGRQSHRESQARKSFANLETTRMEHLEEKESSELSELFEGFLAIGTLGTTESTVISEPETPTFAVSFEKLAEGETEVTENELRLINDELERVLAIEAKEDGWTDSSSRNSHVSNGRMSHASTITLSGKALEIGETQNMMCPLQEYLLGSAVECGESKTSGVKKENRMSLGELFERHKAEEISESNKCKKKDDKDGGDKTRMNIMKKILKKKIAHAASFRTSSNRGNTEDPVVTSADTKFCKILQKFHRKVHPEYVTSTEKSNKIGIKDMIACNGRSYKDENPGDDNNSNITNRVIPSGYMQYNKSRSIPNHFLLDHNAFNKTKECWIRTDADYLVLEL